MKIMEVVEEEEIPINSIQFLSDIVLTIMYSISHIQSWEKLTTSFQYPLVALTYPLSSIKDPSVTMKKLAKVFNVGFKVLLEVFDFDFFTVFFDDAMLKI